MPTEEGRLIYVYGHLHYNVVYWLAPTLLSQSTTSFIAGLLQGFWSTHRMATSSTLAISSSNPFPLNRGSKISSSLPSFFICRAHTTSSLEALGLKSSTGLFPVNSSSITTPKLYISPLRVATHDWLYSGGMYPSVPTNSVVTCVWYGEINLASPKSATWASKL
ncbi:pre-mRNA-processing factor 17 [Striga asiatica]|uniref:Pre-mRNA-processing factor 17 n=1 Tax=Striga asiatica TaxID=4170 RepID=A0A5A7RAM3_STRAF|nr:pre-mRNA-processing factor 17 [Striga asiatica]